MKASRTALIAIAIIAFLVAVVLPVGLSITAYRTASATDRKIDALSAKIDTNAKAITSLSALLTPQPKAANNSAPTLADQITLGFVAKKSGHGTEGALKRQLVANPAYWGFVGDTTNKTKVGKWADHSSAVFATEGGYVEWKFGAQVLVHGDVSFVLQKDDNGKIHIVEYVVTTTPSASSIAAGDKTFSPAVTHTLAKNISSSQCFGVSPTTGNKLPVPHWEYVSFPGE